jgi:hypothetical protein
MVSRATTRGLGTLAALWLLAQARGATASSSPSSPSSPTPTPTPTPAPPGRITTLPPIEDLDDGPDLLDPPSVRTDADNLWERYATDPERPGPVLMTDELAPAEPVDRYLTEFERWALRPYFPVAADLDTKIHNGKIPMAVPAAQVPGNLWALTVAIPPGSKPEIWFPNGVRPLYQRWWLGVLAHEITHAAQTRIGMTPRQALDALLTYGYKDSPIERQARWMQRRVLNGLDARARAFYPVKA